MGIALLALSDLFTPIQSLLSHRWMTRSARGTHQPSVALDADLRYVQVRPHPGAARHPAPCAERPARAAARPSRPLRVVRLTEADGKARAGSSSARVLLSGRMEDVCAELDRLAALEAAQSPAAGSRHLH